MAVPVAALAQQPPAAPLAPPPMSVPLRAEPAASEPVYLDPRTMVRLVVERNAEVIFNRLQNDIASYGVDAQAAMYEAVLFATIRREDRDRQRTIEERLTTPLS